MGQVTIKVEVDASKVIAEMKSYKKEVLKEIEQNKWHKVAEGDLEKIIEQSYFDNSVTDTDDMDHVTYENIAKYFFELGIKAQKEKQKGE